MKGVRVMTRTVVVLMLVITLHGCGGGGGGGDGGGSGGAAAPPPTQSVAGIWEGTLSEGGFIVNDASCLVTETNELACILFDASNGALAGAAQGTVQVASGNSVSGSGVTYAAPGYVLTDGSSVRASFTITAGTVAERSTLNVTISSLGRTSIFSGTFNPLYERDSSLSIVAGSYALFDVYGDPASFSIDANGVLFSQTQSGCVGNGQVTVIDPQVNGYRVQATVSNCPGLNGNYEGLAVTTDLMGTNDVFLFGVFNSNAAIVGAPTK